jgi:hypothetical protein
MRAIDIARIAPSSRRDPDTLYDYLQGHSDDAIMQVKVEAIK